MDRKPAVTQFVLLLLPFVRDKLVELWLVLLVYVHEELFVSIERAKHLLVLIDVSTQSLNFIVQQTDGTLDGFLSTKCIVRLLFVLLRLTLILLNELDELHAVLLQVYLAVLESLTSRIFLFLQLIYLLDDGVMR